MRRPFVLALTLLLGARPLPGTPLEDALSRGPYSRTERDEVLAALGAAEARGIPQHMLLPRIEEASAKRVPAPRLVQALTAEADRLERARSLLEGQGAVLRGSGPWQRTANLLAWGAADGEILVLCTASAVRPQDYQAVSALFVSLAEWGVDREVALRLAAAAGLSPLPADDFAGLTAILSSARRGRQAVDRAALRLLDALPRSRTLSQLEDYVLNE